MHRLIEEVKHMLAVWMDLGDPGNVSEMLSPEFTGVLVLLCCLLNYYL